MPSAESKKPLSLGWLVVGTVQRCIAVIGLASTLAGVVTLAVTAHQHWAWLAIGGMALIMVGVAWTARDEHQRRIALENATHKPPGGGLPVYPPVEYQVDALRQVIPRLAEAGLTEFGYRELEETLKNLPRQGTDPLFEPLRSYDEGLERMVELGELEKIEGGGWRFVGS